MDLFVPFFWVIAAGNQVMALFITNTICIARTQYVYIPEELELPLCIKHKLCCMRVWCCYEGEVFSLLHVTGIQDLLRSSLQSRQTPTTTLNPASRRIPWPCSNSFHWQVVDPYLRQHSLSVQHTLNGSGQIPHLYYNNIMYTHLDPRRKRSLLQTTFTMCVRDVLTSLARPDPYTGGAEV